MSKSSFTRGFVKQCQICNSANLDEFINLGFHPAVNDFFETNHKKELIETYPMPILYCKECDLIQLGIHVHPEKIFPQNYAYRSGTTKILIENFKNLTKDVQELIKFQKNDLVIDIGSNDGTLLKNFKDLGINVLGIEPTGVAELAIKSGINTENIPFSYENALKIKQNFGKARVITAANVFAHIENVNDIVKGINELLTDDGVFISENHYLSDLLETLQYDTFYHEHLRYYSLHSLSHLFKRHDMRIFDSKNIPTHGGSIRVFACKNDSKYTESKNYLSLKNKELTGEDLQKQTLDFCIRTKDSKIQILNLLTSIKKVNKSIVGISAPSRASTLINYIGIDKTMIDYICEINGSLKIGKNIPGTDIPVVNEDFLFDDQPDYAFLFSWHIADELIPKLKKNGYKGKFIIPLPKVKIID
jgi:hypothetical protein